jgi:hypothetical protein
MVAGIYLELQRHLIRGLLDAGDETMRAAMRAAQPR